MDRIRLIQDKLPEYSMDAVIVSSEINQLYTIDLPLRDAYMLIDREQAHLFTDQRYREAAQKALGDRMQLHIATPGQDREAMLSEMIRLQGLGRIGLEEDRISWRAFARFRAIPDCEWLPAQALFTALRARKDAEEQRCMRRAQEISELALEEVLALIRPGMTERQIAAELIFRMLRHGSDYGEFRPIVVSGENTSLPHGEPSDRALREGDFLTMDFGCTVKGYCSDMTRTVAIGYATEEMRRIYAIVLEAQQAGIAAAGPGVRGCEIDRAARRVIEEAGYGAYFVHGFGHGIGLEGHEDPGAGPAGITPLPVGAFISAEPGIYLPSRFGVRIEDVLLITESGAESIAHAPKELQIL